VNFFSHQESPFLHVRMNPIIVDEGFFILFKRESVLCTGPLHAIRFQRLILSLWKAWILFCFSFAVVDTCRRLEQKIELAPMGSYQNCFFYEVYSLFTVFVFFMFNKLIFTVYSQGRVILSSCGVLHYLYLTAGFRFTMHSGSLQLLVFFCYHVLVVVFHFSTRGVSLQLCCFWWFFTFLLLLCAKMTSKWCKMFLWR